MSLLPPLTAQQVSTLATFLASPAGQESDVNGVWNAVLHRFFVPMGFFVKPEVRIDENNRIDLVVSQPNWAPALTWRPIILYEGKGQTGDSWERLKSQLHTYGQASVARGKVVYCVGGKGKQVRFWKFKRDDMIDIKPMDLDPRTGTVRIRDVAEMPIAYDIDSQFGAIEFLMRYITQNLPPP